MRELIACDGKLSAIDGRPTLTTEPSMNARLDASRVVASTVCGRFVALGPASAACATPRSHEGSIAALMRVAAQTSNPTTP